EAIAETVKWGQATNKSADEALTAKGVCDTSASTVKAIARKVDVFAMEVNNSETSLQNAQENHNKTQEFLTGARDAAQSARDAFNKWKEAVNATSVNAQKASEALKVFHHISVQVLNENSFGGVSSGSGDSREDEVMAAFEKASTVEDALIHALLVERDAQENIPAIEKEVISAQDALKRVEKTIEEVKKILPPAPLSPINGKDGSSSPALLRVPLLLLLLSVLGCMTVC
ncbi:uncharacterized protein TM35_000311670, partial [Trypanosoma theileri]